MVAGSICNTWEYDPSDLKQSEESIRQIFREQVQWQNYVECLYGPMLKGTK